MISNRFDSDVLGEDMEHAKKGIDVIEIRFALGSEKSTHKVFARNEGKTIRLRLKLCETNKPLFMQACESRCEGLCKYLVKRDVIEPICELKCVKLDDLGVYLDGDRSASLPLDYDFHMLTGHTLNVIDYKAPLASVDDVDGRLSKTKKSAVDKTKSIPSPSPRKKNNPVIRVTSAAATLMKSVQGVSPTPPRKNRSPSTSGEMYPQRLPTGPSLTRNVSGAAMLAQPGGRRARQSDVIPPMNISSRLLGLSERSHHKKEHSIDDDNHNERREKKLSVADDSLNSGDVSPGGTLHKNPRSSTAKLSVYSLQPQNSKSHHNSSSSSQSHHNSHSFHTTGSGGAELLVSLLHTTPAEAVAARRRVSIDLKEKEKMEVLAELLDNWQVNGLPDIPPLAGIGGLPKFDGPKFEIEDHWTNFIDKTDLTQRQKDQQEALWELLYTEVEYIKALYVIHDLFICCLLNIQNDGVLNEIELENMFSNITELATINTHFWSTELISVLEYSRKNKCLFNPSLLKPAFSNFGERFMPYTKYCIEQKRCSDYVKKNYRELTMFKALVIWAEKQQQCNRLKLHDLLVKPMQRLTRYSLLLRAIHKKTDEEDVKQDLMDMIKNVDKFVTAVDQTLTRADEKEKLIQTKAKIDAYDAIDAPLVDSESSKVLSMYMALDLLSPMPGCGSQLRYNLMEGPLRLRDMNTKIDVHCILFTDMLLFTKPSKRDKLRIIKPPIRIDSLSINEMKDNPHLLLVHLTDFGVAQAAYTLHGDNISKWYKTFKKAQMMYLKAKEAARRESQHISHTELEMDDIGFSGPLTKTSQPVFNEDITNNDTVSQEDEGSGAITPIDTGLNHSPEVKRVASFGNLRTRTTGSEAHEGDDDDDDTPQNTLTPQPSRHVTKSVSSPDIGRKHHTLPHNYKHPPKLKVQRNSSSSSGEMSVTQKEKGSKSGERRRRMGASERYQTADGIVRLPDQSNHAIVGQGVTAGKDTSEASPEQRISFEVGSGTEQAYDSDDDFGSATLNCDINRKQPQQSNTRPSTAKTLSPPTTRHNNNNKQMPPQPAARRGMDGKQHSDDNKPQVDSTMTVSAVALSGSSSEPLTFYQNGGASAIPGGSGVRRGVTPQVSLDKRRNSGSSSSKKNRQMDIVRMKKFQDFLNDSAPGVEI